MEKMRLGAALATLRADMEALSAAHAPSPPGILLPHRRALGAQVLSVRALLSWLVSCVLQHRQVYGSAEFTTFQSMRSF